MTQVTVKYFGLASSRAGKRSEIWTLPAGATLATLKDLLSNKYRFETDMTIFYNLNGKGITVNALGDCRLADGDMVMIIPQISGG